MIFVTQKYATHLPALTVEDTFLQSANAAVYPSTLFPRCSHPLPSCRMLVEIFNCRSRVDYNRINAKTTALLKSLSAGRPNLTVVRLVVSYCRRNERMV